MDNGKRRAMASCLLLLCVLHALVRSTQALSNVGIVYAIERDNMQKNIFALDFSVGVGMEQSTTLVANMTQAAAEDPDGFPMDCFGYENGVTRTGPLYEFSPNGLAYDGDSRLYFVAFDQYGMTTSRLCFYSIATDTFEFAANLGEPVVGAAFDSKTYQYVWIDQGEQQNMGGIMVLQFARLDRTTGQIMERETTTMFRNVTTNPNAPAAELPFTFRGGDMAIDCNGMLYGSSVGTGGGFKYFFTIDLNYDAGDLGETPEIVYAYRLIHADVPDDPSQVSTLTGFATADQLAFDMDGRLISQDSEQGVFSVVDIATGANGELGVEGEDYIRLYEMGMLRTFADLASSLSCEVPTPTPTPTPTSTSMPTPTPEYCCSPDDEGAVCKTASDMPEESSDNSDSDYETMRMITSMRSQSKHSRGRGRGHYCRCSSSSDSDEEVPCCPCTCPTPPPTAPVCGNVGSDGSAKGSGKRGGKRNDNRSGSKSKSGGRVVKRK
ncbi:hypothetical protein FVE85_9675 [Porphyridium purpureum]|uniref:Phytase-like domain-containing protein n=1 Tax=Porphyridium purpureum TaxID=35688 RepID=A0A5J4YK55_PORPP|nr:hypothetical protein FVE85_9675 [Porphyridium purpureum]|eukprot:POR0720..scf246_12